MIVFCIDKQMGHYELITAWFFFGKLALKKHFFEVHTPKFADPPSPIVHTCCEIFLLFFWWLPLLLNNFYHMNQYIGHTRCFKLDVIIQTLICIPFNTGIYYEISHTSPPPFYNRSFPI